SELEPLVGFEGPWIQTPHGRKALAIACRNFFGPPERDLRLTGVTGTNGKTTVTYLVDAVMRAAGKVTGVVGTIGNRIAGQLLPAVNTTPESLDLYHLFDQVRGNKGSHVAMEVSSHGLELGRAYGLAFHTAIFTNLTRDHLDFHHTMEAYFEAKQKLFLPNGAAAPNYAVINLDDEYGPRLRTAPETRVITYGLHSGASVRATSIRMGYDGLEFTLCYAGGAFPVRSPLIGEVNVYNVLAACAAGLSYGMELPAVAEGIAACQAVAGRFERIDEGQPFWVVVDYAHTDDALRNAIRVARTLKPKRVITLFGCGGDRDRTKRPLMGMAAGEFSDFVVLTPDNPRGEDPASIMNDAMVGLRRFDTPHSIEIDREKAIRMALAEAAPGDLVLLAGKGHETYQILKDRTIDFDDREVARRILNGMGFRRVKA
ncbi:MAG: UDP-N-acetylmuramoyl-L-alanyl-D-glutamate--2,6-diaminopimelate ligase, partial [Bryobacteraceae bacterium]|nr:UDP-N-acetylmuramoyl-L-alanyl-D-glutamate--2,6-diaminopimelate ligase [Bryobacteraceae bacterium]